MVSLSYRERRAAERREGKFLGRTTRLAKFATKSFSHTSLRLRIALFSSQWARMADTVSGSRS
jgi:hypothetical protein